MVQATLKFNKSKRYSNGIKRMQQERKAKLEELKSKGLLPNVGEVYIQKKAFLKNYPKKVVKVLSVNDFTVYVKFANSGYRTNIDTINFIDDYDYLPLDSE